MATVMIEKTKLEAAYKYGNLIRNKAKRDYAFAYIAWLKNGAEGLEPDKGKLSYMGAQAVRMTIDSMKLWEQITPEFDRINHGPFQHPTSADPNRYLAKLGPANWAEDDSE